MSSPNLFDDETLEPSLMCAARRGNRDAYAELWRRHQSAALRTAKPLAFSNAEDVVSEAFLAIWQQMQAGGGPQQHFRAYTLATVRNLAIRRYHAERRVLMVAEVDGDPLPDSATAVETAEDAQEVCHAFNALPERWQQVLWWSEVENLSRGDIAERLNLTPNSVSALARRAKEGLRLAWLEEALPAQAERQHPQIQALLPRFVRGRLGRKDRAEVRAHLAACAPCHALATELRRVNHCLGGHTAGVLGVLLVGGVAGALATTRISSRMAAALLIGRVCRRGILPKLLTAGPAVLLTGAAVGWGLDLATEQSPPPVFGGGETTSAPATTEPTESSASSTSSDRPEHVPSPEDAPTTAPPGSTADSHFAAHPFAPGAAQGSTHPDDSSADVFSATQAGTAGIAPEVTGRSMPGGSVDVSVSGLHYAVPVLPDGTWSTDLSTLGLGVGSYAAQLAPSERGEAGPRIAVAFSVSAPTLTLLPTAGQRDETVIALAGLPAAQVCARLGAGSYQLFTLDAAGTGGGTLSAPVAPGMTVRAGYCNSGGRFGPGTTATR